MSEIDSIIKRFRVLYPKLITGEKDHAPIQQKIKICLSLAKSEAVSLPQESRENMITALNQLINNILASESYSPSEEEIFVLALSVQISLQQGNKAQFLNDLLHNLFVKAHKYVKSKQFQWEGEEHVIHDVSLNGDQIFKDQLELCSMVLRKLTKVGNEGLLVFLGEMTGQLDQYLKSQNEQYLNLEEFAPLTITYTLLEQLVKSKHCQLDGSVLRSLDNILMQTFNFFDVFRTNSKYFMITIASSKNETEKQVRRQSGLFTDILDTLVSFSCIYLKKLGQIGHSKEYLGYSQRLWNTLYSSEDSEVQNEYFTLRERLKILNELNSLFNQIPFITDKDYYWRQIRNGLVDQDNYCRKVSMGVLKANLKLLGKPETYSNLINQEEFELLWTTFFDVYDTLESFGSHLTKALWDRTEVLFKFIKQHYGPTTKFHPLIDFKEWLLVIYRRVQSHSNLKLRRYVQKSTLKRTYMTNYLGELMFDVFLQALNKGLIFKDSNIYTQFSKNFVLVLEFYERYFSNESIDLAGDLRAMFKGLIKNVSHPQMILCTLKILSRAYTDKTVGVQFVGQNELKLLSEIINTFFMDQLFSSKYLCYKYILQMLTLYIDLSQLDSLDWSLLLKIIGKMPLEFFSTQTFFVDQEAIDSATMLVDQLGAQTLYNTLASYINDMFQVKAVVTAMPKFGSEIDQIIKGVSRLITTLSIKYEDRHNQQFQAIMKPNWEAFTQIMNSSYLSSEVLDSKVHYMSLLMGIIYNYGTDKFKAVIRPDYIANINLAFDRFDNNMLQPLTKYDAIANSSSEKAKLQSLFSELKHYTKSISICIKMVHIDQNQSNNALEKIIKTILQLGLKVTTQQEQIREWASFLLQYVVFKCLKQITKCYSRGIRECIKKGIQYFFVPEDIFTFGKPLLQNLIDFKQLTKPLEDQLVTEQLHFLVDNELNLTNMSQSVMINQWKIMAELVQIFQFEAQLKQDLLLLYPSIAEKAQDFLSMATEKYNTSIFKILKLSYLPLFIQKLQSGDPYKQDESVQQFQKICIECWTIIKELKTDFQLSELQEFLEFAFSPDVLELYLKVLNPTCSQQVKDFHKDLANDIFEQGNRYWLIMRTAFNHLMFIFATRPHLLQNFEIFVVNFGICREIRSLDSDIMLYKLKTLIPQIIPKGYENLNMEEITYQGAYIRTMTLIVVEELIKRHKKHLMEGQPMTNAVFQFIDAIEDIIMQLLQINYQPQYSKTDMPYSDKHRTKVRLWQFLIVCLQQLDPLLYTPEFRQLRLKHSSRDIIVEVNNNLWKILCLNNIASVRQYIEIFAIRFTISFPSLTIENPNFIKTLLHPNLKPQVGSSYLTIAGYAMTKELNDPNAVPMKQKIFEHMVGFLCSNNAHVRCVAHYFVHLVQKDKHFNFILGAFIPTGLRPVLSFLEENKDNQKLIKKYGNEFKRFDVIALTLGGVEVTLSAKLDGKGEFLSVPFMDQLKDLTSELITEIRNQDFNLPKPEDTWKAQVLNLHNQGYRELERRKQEGEFSLHLNEESSQNYQRKILPWEQVEYDYEQLKRIFDYRKRNEVIMCASLIDKIPNLAGLSRTSEIMNASALVINNRAICETEEFKGVAVTSEKWLPIYEVKEKDLYQYLEFQKSNGYKILGLEQTANSKMLHQFEFPSKCVLVLGKEKEGIPQELLTVLDECIEIPQFGIIRSLNVHVSGALCLWEYTKQHLPCQPGRQ